MLDECEGELARQFAPALWISASDDNPTREPYFAVAPSLVHTGAWRIVYALSYWEDPGDAMFGLYAHHGDSEFIIVEIVPNGDNATTNWVVDWVYLSAHWKTSAQSSGWVHHSNLAYYDGVFRKNPQVWVAEDKHANYQSRSACKEGGGILPTDQCDGLFNINSPEGVSDVWNLGNVYLYSNATAVDTLYPEGTQLLNCRPSRLGRWGEECYWGTRKFAGWSGSSDGARPYRDVFEAFFF